MKLPFVQSRAIDTPVLSLSASIDHNNVIALFPAANLFRIFNLENVPWEPVSAN